MPVISKFKITIAIAALRIFIRENMYKSKMLYKVRFPKDNILKNEAAFKFFKKKIKDIVANKTSNFIKKTTFCLFIATNKINVKSKRIFSGKNKIR